MNDEKTKAAKIPSRFPAEISDILNLAVGAYTNHQVHYIVEFENRINEDILFKAACLLSHSEPILGCRFVCDVKRPYWQRRDNFEKTDLFNIIHSTQTSDISEYITRPFDPSNDTQIEIRLFRNKNDVLCLKVDHVVADAAGAKDVLYLLSNIYNSLLDDPEFVPLPNLEGRRGLSQVFDNISLGNKISAFRYLENDKSSYGFPVENPGDTSGLAYETRFIGSAQFMDISKYARKYKATLNDILLTAFYRSLFTIISMRSEKTPLKVMVPVDLRRYILSKKAEAICNLSSAVYPAITFIPDESFNETLNRVKKKMDAYKSGYPGIVGMIFLTLIINFVFKISGIKKILSMTQGIREKAVRHGEMCPNFSNFGIIDSKLCNFKQSAINNAYGIGPVMFGPGFMLVVSGFNDTLSISVGYSSGCINKTAVERFLDNMLIELKAVKRS